MSMIMTLYRVRPPLEALTEVLRSGCIKIDSFVCTLRETANSEKHIVSQVFFHLSKCAESKRAGGPASTLRLGEYWKLPTL